MRLSNLQNARLQPLVGPRVRVCLLCFPSVCIMAKWAFLYINIFYSYLNNPSSKLCIVANVCFLFIHVHFEHFAMCSLPNWKEISAGGHLPCGSSLFSFVHSVHGGVHPVVHTRACEERANPTCTWWLLQTLLLCSHFLFLSLKHSAVRCGGRNNF